MKQRMEVKKRSEESGYVRNTFSDIYWVREEDLALTTPEMKRAAESTANRRAVAIANCFARALLIVSN